MVAVEYDGGHHQADRHQYVRDIGRTERLHSLGWIVVRVVAEDRPEDVVSRVTRAMISRRQRRAQQDGPGIKPVPPR